MGWGTWAAVRLAGGDALPGIGALATPPLAVTPFVAALSPIPVLLALLLRRWWAAVAASVVALSLVAAVAPRAFVDEGPAARGPVVRVLAANLYFGQADAGELVELVRRTRPDVLSVQELTAEAAVRYEKAGLGRLLPHRVLDTRWGAAGSGLYSRHPLRRLPPPGETRFATPRAEFTVQGNRRVEVTAVHPVPPISSAAYRSWKADMALLPSATRAGEDAAAGAGAPVRILAGDFNATLDHAHLRRLIGRGYADAADRAGAGLTSTWGDGGTSPPLTIDHVLVDRRCAVKGFAVHDVRGSDHRAVFAEVRLP
ncbi:endonuclease/exonuclease/phosphatase family protein [Actinomadura viridis]|uniref:Endonuclease/exonuclease/phosphatase (EEP) superfamily protein YafD n=1 Tax=Actinomadura viridis TaxID=58110 RepID=A0A931D7Y5_9ACTN|nr:endonuclease/exonuclease/phosphatase family protein [Actinomadura viridis]MBG6086099.1 endonuclease/exonuclease/phosphatase (EEP) superfamily protein YafD [Actinomadura viridis]